MAFVRRKELTIVVSSIVVAVVSFSATTGVQWLYDTWTINTLITRLASPDEDVRGQALESLRHRNVDTVPCLLRLLKHESDIREFAAWCLNQELPTPPAAIEAFIGVVNDERADANVRWIAILKFARIGQQAHGPLNDTERRVVEALCVAVRSSDPGISASAASALGQFGPRASIATEPLRKATKRHPEYLRAHAAAALVAVNPDSRDAMLPLLLGIARSEDPDRRHLAIHLLGALGSRAKPALPALRRLLAETAPDFSDYVNQAISLIEGS